MRVFSCLALLSVAAAAQLPAPARLMVEGMPAPDRAGELLTISVQQPRVSFLPHSEINQPENGAEMVAYRIIITAADADADAAPAWDSGKVMAASAVHVKVGANLTSLTAYSWTAQWWSSDSSASPSSPSPTSSSTFVVGPGAYVYPRPPPPHIPHVRMIMFNS